MAWPKWIKIPPAWFNEKEYLKANPGVAASPHLKKDRLNILFHPDTPKGLLGREIQESKRLGEQVAPIRILNPQKPTRYPLMGSLEKRVIRFQSQAVIIQNMTGIML